MKSLIAILSVLGLLCITGCKTVVVSKNGKWGSGTIKFEVSKTLNRVVYLVTAENSLYAREITTDGPGKVVKIDSTYKDFLVSPDGQWVVYTRKGSTSFKNELMAYNLKSNVKNLLATSGPAFVNKFISKDSKKVIFLVESNLTAVNLEDSKDVNVLDTGVVDFIASENGAYLSYVKYVPTSDAAELFSINVVSNFAPNHIGQIGVSCKGRYSWEVEDFAKVTSLGQVFYVSKCDAFPQRGYTTSIRFDFVGDLYVYDPESKTSSEVAKNVFVSPFDGDNTMNPNPFRIKVSSNGTLVNYFQFEGSTGGSHSKNQYRAGIYSTAKKKSQQIPTNTFATFNLGFSQQIVFSPDTKKILVTDNGALDFSIFDLNMKVLRNVQVESQGVSNVGSVVFSSNSKSVLFLHDHVTQDRISWIKYDIENDTLRRFELGRGLSGLQSKSLQFDSDPSQTILFYGRYPENRFFGSWQMDIYSWQQDQNNPKAVYTGFSSDMKDLKVLNQVILYLWENKDGDKILSWMPIQ